MSRASTWLPRPLHAGAWWLWALGLAAAASRTTNPVLLGLIVAVAGYVVAARRPAAPWARSFGVFCRLAVLVVVLRLVFHAMFGAGVGGSTVLITLPRVPLPDWAAGVRIGGPVTAEGLALAFYDAARLGTVLVCLGAANALADPRRLLRSLPGALYEVGVALVVALSFAPRLVEDAVRIRAAHRLRGRPVRGLRAVRRLALPLLEGCLERSLDLAAAMDSRGFGRRGVIRPAARRASGGLVLGGLVGACVGVYGLLDAGAPPGLAAAGLTAGGLLAAAGLWLGSRGSARTRYRPDPWALPEWLVAGSGLAAAACFAAAAASGSPGMDLLVVPLASLAPPPLAVLGALLGLLPALVAPPLPRPRATPAPSPAGAGTAAGQVGVAA